ncbi:class I SAM-dependent methyltransferase [Patescibacteria group bacterium]|nr:class I SAM-dependent methyltransferase [Patescibacteria group bacterium]MBU1963959.1 class I SAM-dependent methyltransferase [Patescibacteria group bacterium]
MSDEVWTNYYKYFLELGKSRNIHQFGFIYSRRDMLLKEISKGSAVLDVGAGQKWIGDFLKKSNLGCRYFSMDPDNNNDHDFNSLEEINQKFDAITLFDVAEHLNTDQLTSYLEKIHDLLNENGKLIISIPNIFYVGNSYFTTCNHIGFYSYMDLHCFIRSAGFKKTNIFRLTNKIWQLNIKLPIYLIRHIIRLIVIKSFPYADYATDIIIIGKK